MKSLIHLDPGSGRETPLPRSDPMSMVRRCISGWFAVARCVGQRTWPSSDFPPFRAVAGWTHPETKAILRSQRIASPDGSSREMDLASLIQDLPVRLHAGPAEAEIDAIIEDSRMARPGCLFVARTGRSADGRSYVDDALQRGASAILTDRPDDMPQHVPVLIAEDPGRVGIDLAQRLWNRPAERLTLIGITGTNGKTTTAFMVRHLLHAAGHRCGLIGTIEIDDGRTARPAAMTTPGAIEMISLLGRMADHDCDHVVMEVSSHALDQGRVEGLNFAAGVFTNLSGDHLDYHGTMERYAQAKARLFSHLGAEACAVVNADDPASATMLAHCKARRLTFAMDQPAAALSARILEATSRDTHCLIEGIAGRFEVRPPLIGRHNIANLLAAFGAVIGLGIKPELLREAINQCPPVPGRLEPVATPENLGIDVLVDYAHTDDALANVLRALRPLTRSKLHVVFGCGGDRDPTKRPRMAAVACDGADAIMITSDNPRTEDPHAIVEDILKGVGPGHRPRVSVEIDRRAAIAQTLASAQSGDVVLIAGKGHEDYQIIGHEKRPFDDRVEARRVIEQIAGGKGRK